ncbi:MAG: MBL fold metallo-hydrolase [Promethearchaeota archaeon]
MTLPNIENLEIRKVTDDVLLIHQTNPPFYFSCCDGLIILPKERRNTKTIILDLNIEPNLINQINDLYGPISNYVCTHGHMDHIAHNYHWEKLGASIYAPIPEDKYLLDLHNFYEGFGFNKHMDYSVVEKFGKINGYQECNNIIPFLPGEILKFENFTIKTIPLIGHSKSHIGFLIPNEKIIHISCLGFDIKKPGEDGFGPWYGFEECSIDQYFEDINLCETLYREKCDFLTSSHSYVVKKPDFTPFTYMREKIQKNQSIIDRAIESFQPNHKSEINIQDFLELDLFFPKRKMKGFLKEIYNYWEIGFISKHIERSKYFT